MSASMMLACLRRLEKFKIAGQDVEAVIDQSIAGGYQGFFEVGGVIGEVPRQQPATAPQMSKDDRICVKCRNTGHWYPGGPGKGVAPCRQHEYEIADTEPEPPTSETVTAIKDYVRKVAM